jgi:hypothetical protein
LSIARAGVPMNETAARAVGRNAPDALRTHFEHDVVLAHVLDHL